MLSHSGLQFHRQRDDVQMGFWASLREWVDEGIFCLVLQRHEWANHGVGSRHCERCGIAGPREHACDPYNEWCGGCYIQYDDGLHYHGKPHEHD